MPPPPVGISKLSLTDETFLKFEETPGLVSEMAKEPP